MYWQKVSSAMLVRTAKANLSSSSTVCSFDICLTYVPESCSEEAAHSALRTLIDLGVSGSFYVSV